MDKIRRKIDFLRNSYLILNYMLYTKFYVTEGVLAKTLGFYFPSLIHGGNPIFLNTIKQELAFYRQQLAETYDIFSSDELCTELKNFIKNTKITIDTLTINNPEKISIMFNNAISRISASINDLAANDNLLNIGSRSAYELMYNLINEYYLNWEKVIKILFNDAINETKLKGHLMMTVIVYFIFSLIIIFIFLKLLSKFSLEREKPINLFLTLKKAVFENLKNCAENFSNKILNKFFGIEDNEEESQQDYQENIQPNDINIAKFKAQNEIKSSILRAFSFINYIIVLIIFIFINLSYFVISYLDFRNRMKNIFYFISFFDKINYAQSNLILSINIFKSFLFNRNIPILNFGNTEMIFFENFLNLSNKFETSIIYTSNNKAFLKGHFIEQYDNYLYGDFHELLIQEYYQKNAEKLETYIKYGLKPLEIRIFEEIRYFTLEYCDLPEEDRKNNEISIILKKANFRMAEIIILIHYIMRNWYDGALTLIINSFFGYQNYSKLAYNITFFCLIIIAILYYSIIWKTYEEKLNILLKGSADLINLIPQEIKNIIIQKLNE